MKTLSLWTTRALALGALALPFAACVAADPESADGEVGNAQEASVDPAFVQQVAQKLAPIVHLHPDDDYRPSSVDWYLSHVALYNGKTKVVAKGALDTPTLLSYVSSTNPNDATYRKWALTADEANVNYSPGGPSAVPPGPDVTAIYAGEAITANQSNAQAYVHITPPTSGLTYKFQYWFFYPYNGGLGFWTSWHCTPLTSCAGVGAHEGDWETISVWADLTPPTVSVRKISFSQHTDDEIVPVSGNQNVPPASLVPPDVYSAWHSHASYSTPGTVTRLGGIADDYASASGPVWNTGANLLTISDGSPGWVFYPGDWGTNSRIPTALSLLIDEQDAGMRGEGPMGPFYKDSWRDPAQLVTWESLGGVQTLGAGPAVSSWGNGRLDVFTHGTDDTLQHRWFDNGFWSNWESLGGQLASNPAAVSWGSGRIDVFARATDGTLQHKWFDNGFWSNWESLGGQLASDPAVASWGSGRLDVFARGTDNTLQHKWWGGAWSGWESLGGALTSSPSAVSWGNNRIDVFARGDDNTLQHRWWGGAWSAWESWGNFLNSAPSAASRAPLTLDIFFVGEDGRLWQQYWNPWSTGLIPLDGNPAANPAAVSWGSDRLDVFDTDPNDGSVTHLWWTQNTWLH